MRLRKIPLALSLVVTVGLYNCGSSDERVKVPGASAGEAGMAEGGGPGDEQVAGQPPVEPQGGSGGVGRAGEGGVQQAGAAGSPAAEAGAAGQGGAGAVVLPDGVLANVPYSCESPFAGVEFASYFHLENFEEGGLATPGVTASSNTLSSSFGASLVDSVDCDDELIDGKCTGCEALYGEGSVEVSFDASVLGALPTHVGMVWTDGGGGASVTITGYDAADAVIYSETVEGIGDSIIYGTVEEDRFFGIVHYEGVKRVVVTNSTGGVEIDHLQYGR
jgi:hypothetical protein